MNYALKNWDNFYLNTGIKGFLFPSQQKNFSSIVGFNPNVSGSYFFANNIVSANFSMGYYFDFSTITPTKLKTFDFDPLIQIQKRSLTSNAISFSPGIKVFPIPNLFLDVNFIYLAGNSNDEIVRKNRFLNVGLGVAF